jgi:hypothetical protein
LHLLVKRILWWWSSTGFLWRSSFGSCPCCTTVDGCKCPCSATAVFLQPCASKASKQSVDLVQLWRLCCG